MVLQPLKVWLQAINMVTVSAAIIYAQRIFSKKFAESICKSILCYKRTLYRERRECLTFIIPSLYIFMNNPYLFNGSDTLLIGINRTPYVHGAVLC